MVEVPYFDGAEVAFEGQGDPLEPGAVAALAAFMALTPADRIADARHVSAYYRDYHEAVGGEDWMDAQMGVPETPADIWRFVEPHVLVLEKGPRGDGHWYVVVDADCGWEEEHGLMLVWRGGRRLTKVGGYDGHLTNEDASDDEATRDAVYLGSNPKHTTRVDDLEGSGDGRGATWNAGPSEKP